MKLNPLVEHHMRAVQHRLPRFACFFRIHENYYRPLPNSVASIPIEQVEDLALELVYRGEQILLLEDLMQHPFISLHHKRTPCEDSPPSPFFQFFVP